MPSSPSGPSSRPLPRSRHRSGASLVGLAGQAPQTSSRRAYNLLREGLRDGSIRSGDRLVEDELSVSLATSRNAVREALRMLHDEGLVTRQRRYGTVVVHGLMDVDLRPLLSERPVPWVPEGVPSDVARRVERRLVPTTVYLRNRLQTDAERVVMVEDVVSNRSGPVSVRIGYFVDDSAAGLDGWPSELARERWWLLPDHGSAFAARFGVPFGHSETSFEATAADARSRRLLGLPEAVPILLMTSLLVDCSGRPQELASFHYAANLVTVSLSSPTGVSVETSVVASGGDRTDRGTELMHAS